MTAALPAGVTRYAATAVFTDKTVPSKLTSSHSTKPGVWGKLLVNTGALDYVIVGPPVVRQRIEAGSFAVIEPEVLHRVDIDGPVSFQVEFYRHETKPEASPKPRRLSRPLWLTLGVTSLGAGTAGVVLPLVPTTPFVLLSAYAFAQSSPRLHGWLVRHQRFGPLIANWRHHGAIDRRTKVLAAVVMILTPLITWAIGAPLWVLLTQIVVLLGALCFVVTRPEGNAAEGPNG